MRLSVLRLACGTYHANVNACEFAVFDVLLPSSLPSPLLPLSPCLPLFSRERARVCCSKKARRKRKKKGEGRDAPSFFSVGRERSEEPVERKSAQRVASSFQVVEKARRLGDPPTTAGPVTACAQSCIHACAVLATPSEG